MKAQQPKLKTQLFSCGFFGHCTQSVLSPTTTQPHSLPLTPSTPPPPPPPPPSISPAPLPPSSSSSSYSNSASQSFTQWRFPLPSSPPPLLPAPPPSNPFPLPSTATPISSSALQELLHLADLQLTSGSDSDRLSALHLLERSLVPNPPSDPVCPPELMSSLVSSLRDFKSGSKPATKILLALCLSECNRRMAVEAGAVAAVIESVVELEDSAAERALATLELVCTVPEGAEEVRAHALAVPVMVGMMGRMGSRAKEYAISVLAVVYGGGVVVGNVGSGVTAPPEEVARAVVLALQGDCSARAKRKGAQLLKALQDG